MKEKFLSTKGDAIGDKNVDLKKNDYVEHWKDGIGKVVETDEGTITIDFQKQGRTQLPKENTLFLKKLAAQGFMAQYFDNPGRIQALIENEPEEIVKLLIRDAEPLSQRIARSRLKSLLTKGDPNRDGWRKDFTMVEDWDAWWKIAIKRLKKDPWIDMTDKMAIVLRQEAVSEIQTLHSQFLKETEPAKKIIVSEQLLKACDTKIHEIILNDVRDFISGLFQDGVDDPYLGQAVYIAINLQKKGVQIPDFDDHKYNLSLHALIRGKLTAQRLLPVYHFFSRLPKQNPNDHVILFLYGGDKLREEIVRNFKRKDGLAKKVKPEGNVEALTPKQSALLSGLSTTIQEDLNQAVAKASATIPEPFVAAFFLAMLLTTGIHAMMKKAVATSVMERRMDQIIYKYFIKVDPNLIGPEIPFLQEFLKIIGPAKAEWAFRNILLTKANAIEKPSIFRGAFKALISDSDPILNRDQRRVLLSEVERLLDTDQASIDKGLLAQISNLTVTVPVDEVLPSNLSNEDVVAIIKTRRSGMHRRAMAIRLLADRGLVEAGRSLTQELIETIERDEFVLLEELMKVFPDTLLIKNALRLLLEKSDMSDSALSRVFVDILKATGATQIFCELILSDQDVEWHERYHQKVEALLRRDESLVEESIRFGLRRILSEQQPSTNLKSSFMLYLAPFMKGIIDEMSTIALEREIAFKNDLQNLSVRHDEELRARVSEFEGRLDEASNRMSQRYDQYLKRLILTMSQISEIQHDLEASAVSNKSISDKLSVIREDIEVILRILKVIDTE